MGEDDFAASCACVLVDVGIAEIAVHVHQYGCGARVAKVFITPQ